MPLTRRDALARGATAAAGLGAAHLMPAPALAASEASGRHRYETRTGTLTVHPVRHASLVMTTPLATVYADPVGGAELYADLPAPQLILVTHHHGDHFDPETLAALVSRNEDVQIRTNPAVQDRLPEELRPHAAQLSTGDTTEVAGIGIRAIPAYNTTEDRLQYHPPGRDNGYVLEIDGLRVYVAGDTEDTPEMRELESIDIAFVPMNLPYTMSVEQAAEGVGAFEPRHVYPYHYRGSDIDAFERRLGRMAARTSVVRAEWYPG